MYKATKEEDNEEMFLKRSGKGNVESEL